ncbi:MAG: hypothetical protein KJ709_05700 [Nanoarchaeota archaeon]|nr:hypothetical protein [Nanoarchaeota archaeon]
MVVTEEYILEEYERLPMNSRGREADNPRRYRAFFNDWVFKDNPSFPYLALCRDQEIGGLTWHIGCDQHGPRDWIEYPGKLATELRIGDSRGRRLTIIELYIREDGIVTDDNTHFFQEN